MNKLHPGAKWLFRLNGYLRMGIIGGIIIFYLSNYIFRALKGTSGGFLRFLQTFKIVLVAYLVFLIVVVEVYARMYYNRWLYEITNDGIKLEKGIIWKKYTYIPFKKIQNINIRRGIIARILGFSAISIETAGQSGFGYYGGRKKYRSEGYLPAIDVAKAEKIKDFILKKIQKTGDSGL